MMLFKSSFQSRTGFLLFGLNKFFLLCLFIERAPFWNMICIGSRNVSVNLGQYRGFIRDKTKKVTN